MSETPSRLAAAQADGYAPVRNPGVGGRGTACLAARILAVDPQGFLCCEDALGSAKNWRWRPGGEVELRGEFPRDCIENYASMIPDARRFLCNAAGGIGADAWLLERVDFP